MAKKILVTGANGFCGTHLCEFLTKSGYQVIRAVYRKPADCQDPHTVACDITDPLQVRNAVKTFLPYAIIHLAAQSIPELSWEAPESTLMINTLGTIHLLDAVKQSSPHSIVLFISSMQIYGNACFHVAKPVTEDIPPHPVTPYGYSKRLAELACLNYHRSFGIKTIIARPGNHVGIGQPQKLAFSNWCSQIADAEARNTPVKLKVGNIKIKRDFLHVDDVVSAYLTLIKKGGAGEIYNVCTGKTRELTDYIDYLQTLTPLPFKVSVEKMRNRNTEVPNIQADCSKLEALGWKPQGSVYDALDDLLDDWRIKTYKKR